MYPGYDNFFLGNLKGGNDGPKEFERRKQENLKPVRNLICFSLDHLTFSKYEEDSFDYAQNPTQYINMGSSNFLFTSDPEVVQGMMLTKNAQIDKVDIQAGLLQNFFGDSFLFS